MHICLVTIFLQFVIQTFCLWEFGFTFNEWSDSTACSLRIVISTIVVIVSLSCAQNHSIHIDAESGRFTTIHLQIGVEVVQSISTKRNCEYSSAWVISENKIISWCPLGHPWFRNFQELLRRLSMCCCVCDKANLGLTCHPLICDSLSLHIPHVTCHPL